MQRAPFLAMTPASANFLDDFSHTGQYRPLPRHAIAARMFFASFYGRLRPAGINLVTFVMPVECILPSPTFPPGF